jgi:hypothetical protein
MKICAELDDKTEDQWQFIKKAIESRLQRVYGVSSVIVPNNIMIMCLLWGWGNELADIWLDSRFSQAEVEAMGSEIKR